MKIKLFEEFKDEERQQLIDDGLTYIEKNPEIYTPKMGEIYYKIKNYDISGFKLYDKPSNNFILPDEEFKKLLIELNEILPDEDKITIFETGKKPGIKFDFFIDSSLHNEINLYDFFIPEPLIGLKLGYNLYKLIVKKFKYITSTNRLSPYAKNVWYKLICDPDFYAFTSNTNSGVIDKSLDDVELKNILEKEIKKINNFQSFIFDNEIKEKIIQLYGSINNYQK